MIDALWLVVVCLGLVAWTAIDTRQYRRFVQATDTIERQAFYRRWTVQSFVLLTVASLITLLLLDRRDAWSAVPTEFTATLPLSRPAPRSAAEGAGQRVGILVGFSIGALITILVWRRRLGSMRAPIVGNIEPLLPRNAAERWAALPLCLNAGFAEELFFRLALPLLIATVTGSPALGMGAAVIIFGLIHWYQGWRGVLGTTVVGALLTVAYVSSGSLLRVMIVHAAIDVFGLIVRPILSERYARRIASPSAV